MTSRHLDVQARYLNTDISNYLLEILVRVSDINSENY